MSESKTTPDEDCGHRLYGGVCSECAWKKFNTDPMNTISPSPFKDILDRYADGRESVRRFWEGKGI